MKRTVVIPAICFLVATASALGLWRVARNEERRRLEFSTSLTASQTALRLAEFIDTRLKVVETLGWSWKHESPPNEDEFDTLAMPLVERFGGLLAVNWIDPDGIIRWVVPADRNAAAKNKSIATHAIAGPVLEAARTQGRTRVTPPLHLFQGGLGFAAYIPLTDSAGRPAGFLNAVFRLAPMVGHCLRNGIWPRYTYRITFAGEELYRERHYAQAGTVKSEAPLPVGESVWALALHPTRRVVAARPVSDRYSLIVGLLLGIAVAVLSRLVLERRERTRRMQRERLELERNLLQVQKLESLGVLAGGIAHDFNNLLHTISGNIELARDEVPPQSSAMECLDDVAVAARHASDLCRQMLTYSGRRRAEVRPLNINDVIREMLPLLRASASRRVDVRFIPDEVPATIGDEAQLRQVVMNLVTNAAEAIEGSGEVTIRTGCRSCVPDDWKAPHNLDDLPPGDFVFIEVADSGQGMAPDKLRQIFDPFYTTKFTGRGLGLATVLGIVRAHRGAITARSTPEEGTRMSVFLPADQKAVPTRSVRPAKMESEVPHAAHAGGTILVVDDDDSVRVLVERMLGVSGYSTVGAPDGRTALELLEANARIFDCVLLDVTMPGMDGLAVVEELKRKGIDIPIILSSGYATADFADRLSDVPQMTFVGKPYQRAALVDAVERALGPQRVRR